MSVTTINPSQIRGSNSSMSAHNFSQSPGGSLAIGPNTITLTPVPPGLNASDTNHYLYISGGTGTAESVLITGGTAVSGAASGTITFTCLYAHSGAWAIQSATAGLAEAIIAAGNQGGVYIPPGNYTFYAEAYIPWTSFSIWGAGVGVSVLTQASTTANLIHQGPFGGYLDVENLDLNGQSNATAGTLLYMESTSAGNLDNLRLYQGYNHIYIGSPNTMQVSNIRGYYAKGTGLELQAVTAGPNMAGDFVNVNMGTISSLPGLLIHTQANRSVVGLAFTGGGFASGGAAVKITDDGQATTAIHEIDFTGVLMTGTVYGLWADANITTGSGISVLRVTGGTYLASQGSGGRGGSAVYLGKGVRGATFNDCFMEAADIQPMILCTGCADVSFVGCRGWNGNGGGSSYAVQITTYTDGTVCDQLTFRANQFGMSPYSGGALGLYGLVLDAHAHTNCTFSGNTWGGSVQAIIYQGTGSGNVFHDEIIYTGSGGGSSNQPLASSGIKGSTWYSPGSAGVQDHYQVCAGDSGSPQTFAWRNLY